MATINIGSLSLSSHKGDYDNSTSYVKNDVVYYASTGSAYIAKQATTGNLPTSTAHWNVFAAGSGGIWNSGLALGSASQKLRVNSGGTALEFFTETPVTSDYVKLHSAYDVAAAGEINLNGFFNDDYTTYRILASVYDSSGGGAFYIRMRTGTNGATEQSSGNYHWAYTFRSIASGGATQQGHQSGYGNNEIRQGWNGSNFGTRAHQPCCLDITLHQPTRASRVTSLTCNMTMWDNSYFGHSIGGGIWHDTAAVTGIKLHSSSNIAANYVKILGYKD
jgi:hypothetical protein|tara:strand:- start:241 stop:1071 length:831 start_codon:yes stop_codon:yes gene_type:complete